MLRLKKFPVKAFPGLLQNVVPSFDNRVITRKMRFIKDNHPPKHRKLFPLPKYGGEGIVTLLTGESFIGKQGATFIRTLFETAKVPVVFERIEVGPESKKFPREFVNSVRRNRCALHVDIQYIPEEKQKSILLNSELDLYACIIKMHSFEGFNCRYPGVDITVLIQNNVGDYAKLEYEPVPGIVETLKITEAGYIERYIRFAYNYAKKHCRKKITFGHKEAELPLMDGMFLDIAERVHKEYQDIQIEIVDIDKLILDLIMEPRNFDMICTGDRYGTTVASICSSICGGPSLFGATELGDHHAVFKPLQTKLSISDIRTLSPYGIVRACIDLLTYLGNHDCAKIMFDELMITMLENKVKTKEFGGCNASEFVICDMVNRLRCKPF